MVVAAGIVATAVVPDLLTSADQRHARTDVDGVADAVAALAGDHESLPRVWVSMVEGTDGEPLPGDVYLVETIEVPRSNLDSLRPVLVAGDPDRWCVEATYSGRASFFDVSPYGQVSVVGNGSDRGRVTDDRCGDGYVLTLMPASESVIAPGSIAPAASLPAGTCVADPFSGTSLAGLVDETDELEVVDCAEPHGGEIYHQGTLPDGSFDADTEWTEASTVCEAASERYVGVPPGLSALTYETRAPSERQWETGIRTFGCVAYLSSQDYPMVGTIRDSRR